MDYLPSANGFIKGSGRLRNWRIFYRIRQFWQNLTAVPGGKALAQANAALSPSLMGLFSRLQAGEQAHSLAIFHQLCEQGENNQDLLVAALLHDVGKTRYPLQLWERVWVVLGKTFWPKRAREWGRAQPRGWKKAFVVAEQHAAWGAEMAAQAGASALAVSLICFHQDRRPVNHPGSLEDQLLYRLQRLDNES